MLTDFVPLKALLKKLITKLLYVHLVNDLPHKGSIKTLKKFCLHLRVIPMIVMTKVQTMMVLEMTVV